MKGVCYMTKNTNTDDILDTPAEEIQEVEATAVENDTVTESSVLSEDVDAAPAQKTEKKKCFLSNITLEGWIIICSLFAIGFQFLATLLVGITSSYIVYQVFAYIGYAAMIAGVVVYIVQLIRNRVVAFTPQLVLLMLAIFISTPTF